MIHQNTILSLLARCKSMRELKKIAWANNLVFRQIDAPSVYIWNSMIRGFVNNHNPRMSMLLYRQLIENGYSPDHFTFPFVLKALKSGFEADAYTATGLLHMYVSCADMKSGLKVFDNIPIWNVVAWTCLIAGYVNNNQPYEALKVFKDMSHCGVEPNEITMVNALIPALHIRKAGYDPFMSTSNSNIILATAILEMYAKCGSFKIARDLFNKMPQRNIVSWNSMINAYNQYERHKEALDLFFDMWTSGIYPDKATFLSVLSVCAHLCALALGQTVHAYLSLQKRDVVMWTSMINGLAMHGDGNEALGMFQTMHEDSSLVPDHITYIGVLFACSHVGLVEEAKKHFRLMTEMYSIVPGREHYGCMVDLLSRSEDKFRLMYFHSPIHLFMKTCVANQVKERLTELESCQSGAHVLLSNIYAKAGRWEDVNGTRKVMKHKRITKIIGHSSVEMMLLS
ncbi:hypothetical protein AAZX31_19G222000 [Glycine max]